MDNIQRYRYRTRKGNSALSPEAFYTGAVQNERILQKKETYKELVKTLGGKRADYSAVFIGFAEVVRRVCGRGNCVQIEGFGTFRNVCRGGFETSRGPWVKRLPRDKPQWWSKSGGVVFAHPNLLPTILRPTSA